MPLQRSKVRQTFCWWCFPPHSFFFFTPFSCYLNFQTSALMSFVGTSRGLLAHGQVLVLVSRRESRILPGEPVGPAHSSLASSWSSAGRAHSHSRSRSPDAASPRALGLRSAPRLRGVVRVHQDFLPSFKSLSKGICLPSERLRRGCLTAAY